MLVKFAIALLVLSVLEQVVGLDNIDVHDNPSEKPASQKGRMSLQNTAEIQHCLVSAGDVGCGVFECFENNSCEIRGLQEICLTFLHNAGKFDSQLQRECYLRHNLCSAAKENVAVMVEMIHFQDLFPKGPYVELVNILLSCGEEVKEALTRSVRLQCEQNWGALCDSLSVCSSLTPPPGQSPASPDHRRHGSPHSEPDHARPPRQGDKDKSSKGGFNVHPRSRSQGPRRQSPEAGVVAEQEDPEATDIRR
ncbi:stanniocalcin-2-like isoform X2 [Salvelinus fontinalis]|uniref:stanniocalcin-2-like isoform X2 n=1 Tax=Salvelinus fontinalis TaxID=8038 RepID=UPI002485E712|nr:stanniocalcin-2-like isoform X2 [Salvelinus fontinalis]